MKRRVGGELIGGGLATWTIGSHRLRRCHERPRADEPVRLDGGDPRLRRPAGLGCRSRRLRGLRQPGRPRGARLRRPLRAARPLRARRDPLQAPRRIPVSGRGLPNDQGSRDGGVGADGRGLVRPPRRLDVPGLLHLDAARHARRAGCGRRLQGHRGAARGRAGAARARGDPGDGRPAGVGDRCVGPLSLRQSGGAGRARVLRAFRSGRQAGPRHGPLQVPGRRTPRRTARWFRRARRERRCRTPTTGWCARTARSCASPTRRRPSSCPTGWAR